MNNAETIILPVVWRGCVSELDCEGGRCQVTRWLQLDLYNASTQMLQKYIFVNVMTIDGGSLNYFLGDVGDFYQLYDIHKTR